MKNTVKRIFNFVLAFVLMIMPLVTNVNAATNDNEGVITITGAVKDKNYSVYQLFVLESYNNESKGYIYKVNSTWSGLASYDGMNAYIKVDNDGYVTWVGEETEEAYADFAKKALKYAKDNSISPTRTVKSEGDIVVIDSLNLGYYLVDLPMGALCGLRTTKKTAEIAEKNTVPSVTKQVEENKTGEYGKENSANIGETVNFKTTITVGEGAENYKLYDNMSEGLTFNDDIVIKIADKTLVSGTDYEIIEKGDHKFVVSIKKALNAGEIVEVTYSAKLNDKAVVGTNGNTNTTYLEYGDEIKTDSDTTKTYTYSFDLVKTDDKSVVLEGAEFKLYDAKGNIVPLVEKEENSGIYFVNHGGSTNYVIKVGIATIKGLEEGTYYLEETKNPDGYTKLSGREKIEINKDELLEPATVTDNKYVSGGVRVINKTGNSLPETGGIGTVLFITIGSLMTLIFGLLLVTKIRMSKMYI